MKIIIAYATKNGSTTDVARAIGSRLREHGCSVEIQFARDVRSVKGFDLLVVGAPIYSGQWLHSAHRILKRTSKLPPGQIPAIAIFALGPRRNEGPENWVVPRAQFERAMGKHSSINPVATGLFGGADPPKKTVRKDIRDWDAIKAWADELAEIIDRSSRQDK